MNADERHMRRALELAELGRYSVSPNPMVGCVVTRGGETIGEGHHHRAGEPHAEIEALRDCGGDARGATVYVTLEPCAHHGRTAPCTEALIAAGVSRVVVATGDPFPRVDGRGIELLRGAGIEVDLGCMAAEARRQNEKFLYSVEQQRPFVLLKAGMSLDGKLATRTRRSRWITSSEARERSLLLREEYDAILVGSGTVRDDDPQLTRRLGRSRSITPWTRVVVDACGDIPSTARLLNDGGRTLVFTASPDRYRPTEKVELVQQEQSSPGALDLLGIFADLHHRGIRSIIAEGGAMLHTDLILRNLWQKMAIFVAPMFIGGRDSPAIYSGEGADELTSAFRFRFDAVERVGPDLMLELYPVTQL